MLAPSHAGFAPTQRASRLFALTQERPQALTRSFVISFPHSSIPPQNRNPLFSNTYTLFSIHNSAHLFCFVITAHSLAKTPRGGGSRKHQFSIRLSAQTKRRKIGKLHRPDPSAWFTTHGLLRGTVLFREISSLAARSVAAGRYILVRAANHRARVETFRRLVALEQAVRALALQQQHALNARRALVRHRTVHAHINSGLAHLQHAEADLRFAIRRRDHRDLLDHVLRNFLFRILNRSLGHGQRHARQQHHSGQTFHFNPLSPAAANKPPASAPAHKQFPPKGPRLPLDSHLHLDWKPVCDPLTRVAALPSIQTAPHVFLFRAHPA